MGTRKRIGKSKEMQIGMNRKYCAEIRSFLVVTAGEHVVTAARGNALPMMCRALLAQIRRCALIVIR
jgi:hypothetical protein